MEEQIRTEIKGREIETYEYIEMEGRGEKNREGRKVRERGERGSKDGK